VLQRLDDRDRLAALVACGATDKVRRPHLDRISELVVQLLDVPVALVSLVDDHRQVFASATGLSGAVDVARETPLSHSFCQFVVTSGEPLVVPDAREHPELRTNLAIADLGVVAYCGAPIRSPDGFVLGAMVAIDHEPRHWTSSDVGVLTAFADVVSSELHTDARYRALTNELHRLLLPAATPSSDEWEVGVGYRPLEAAAGLGGDLYDVVVGADGSVALVVGDIVGHDVGASTAMGQLRAAVVGLLHSGLGLEDIATAVDRSCRELPGVDCSALVLARVAPGLDEVEYLSAGGIPPLLLRGDGTSEYRVDATTPPLGWRGDRRAAHLSLAADDRILLMTDGMVELRGHGLDVGMSALVELIDTWRDLDAQALVDRLMATRLGPAPAPHDDLTVLVWGRRPPARASGAPGPVS